MQRYSFQRAKIYQVVKASREHPTAEMVFDWLKPEMPKLSLGTVYRNLHQMAAEGTLQELPGPVARFDGNVEPHTHFTCAACGGVSDLDLPYDASLDRGAEEGGCRVEHHALMFYGVCAGCAGSQKTEIS